ncbi:MAG TPA: hypothetical protein VGR11_03680 [Solirubrobacteraceae bacterium]|nr:hypothetical protein [Solirubrobacteraceae bacterium]
MSAYVALEQVRHSLVHRRATLGPAGEIVGVDRNGVPLVPLRPAEQEDFCRAVQRAVNALTSGAMNARGRNALLWHLDRIGNVTGLASAGAYEPQDRVPRIELRLDLAQDVDWPKIKAKLSKSFGSEVDIVLVTATGDRLFAHLEDAPDEEARLDLGDPPPWVIRLTDK